MKRGEEAQHRHERACRRGDGADAVPLPRPAGRHDYHRRLHGSYGHKPKKSGIIFFGKKTGGIVMVKILFYDTKPYDKELFENYNKNYGFEIKYLESK